jgi:glycine/D-amino acid oxidase-like deaminating enzyme
MPYLGGKIRAMGGRFVRRRVNSLEDLYTLFPESYIFINASGWGSKLLEDVKDEKCYPDRGQNVLYTTEKHGTLYLRNGQEYTYIIPRPRSGGLILGGVKLGGDLRVAPLFRKEWRHFQLIDSSIRSTGINPAIARDEIRRAHCLAPNVVPPNPPESDLTYIVGIRPNRKDGFRLESQSIGHRTILSAYGFGGGGYAFSYGVADQLLEMVQKAEFEYVVQNTAKNEDISKT